jgi:Uri superfamily endonuclease
VSVTISVRIGRLGRFTFPPGSYVYTGRASRALRARVLRHVNRAARKHWHIDYLLARQEVHVERVVLAFDDPAEECAVNRRVGALGRAAAPGFGSSDCKAGCGTHLWRIVRGRAKCLLPARRGRRSAGALHADHGGARTIAGGSEA